MRSATVRRTSRRTVAPPRGARTTRRDHVQGRPLPHAGPSVDVGGHVPVAETEPRRPGRMWPGPPGTGRCRSAYPQPAGVHHPAEHLRADVPGPDRRAARKVAVVAGVDDRGELRLADDLGEASTILGTPGFRLRGPGSGAIRLGAVSWVRGRSYQPHPPGDGQHEPQADRHPDHCGQQHGRWILTQQRPGGQHPDHQAPGRTMRTPPPPRGHG